MTTHREQHGIDVAAVRDHFPSLSREIDGQPVIYLDGPGGTQVPRECITAMAAYLEQSNANHGGAFAASIETDALLEEVHAAGADFVGAHDPDEIVFGPNMTTLTLALSRAVGRELRTDDEIVVTRLDHLVPLSQSDPGPDLHRCRPLGGAHRGRGLHGRCLAADRRLPQVPGGWRR